MLLEIYVAPHCTPCVQARAIAQEVKAQFPSLRVELIELDGRTWSPPGVVATPTYLLDGRVISLGNPRREWLVQVIADEGKAGVA